MKKYKPIKIYNIHYGYGYWWGNYCFFIGKHSKCFAIVPIWRERYFSIYANNGEIIGHGDCLSWSANRRRERE